MKTKIILIGLLFCLLFSCGKNTIVGENSDSTSCTGVRCKPLIVVKGGLFDINSSILPNGKPYVSVGYIGDKDFVEVEYALKEARDRFPIVFNVSNPDERIKDLSTVRIWGEVLVESDSRLLDKAYYSEETKEGDPIIGYAPLVITISKFEEVE
ncbi:hypothetical protein LAG90_15340 [Marinilongibacter aquaticus]|uniref:hypothetical protein n=1 Tax=Marinilongibacter aquaticus TaxID=2975157 RepID=UPI0021BCFBEA|nr:hypothetical protein [Marinilongibacter aquaticus]UBM58180.1 hypothetical protein LAG90_15340 [Marinilongibacter aquaticus]